MASRGLGQRPADPSTKLRGHLLGGSRYISAQVAEISAQSNTANPATMPRERRGVFGTLLPANGV